MIQLWCRCRCKSNVPLSIFIHIYAQFSIFMTGVIFGVSRWPVLCLGLWWQCQRSTVFGKRPGHPPYSGTWPVPLFNSSRTRRPPALISSMARAWLMSLVLSPLISMIWSPTCTRDNSTAQLGSHPLSKRRQTYTRLPNTDVVTGTWNRHLYSILTMTRGCHRLYIGNSHRHQALCLSSVRPLRHCFNMCSNPPSSFHCVWRARPQPASAQTGPSCTPFPPGC